MPGSKARTAQALLPGLVRICSGACHGNWLLCRLPLVYLLISPVLGAVKAGPSLPEPPADGLGSRRREAPGIVCGSTPSDGLP